MLYPHFMREDVCLTWAIDMKKFLDCRNSHLCKCPGCFVFKLHLRRTRLHRGGNDRVNSSWGTVKLTLTARGQGMLNAVGFSYLLGLKSRPRSHCCLDG